MISLSRIKPVKLKGFNMDPIKAKIYTNAILSNQNLANSFKNSTFGVEKN